MSDASGRGGIDGPGDVVDLIVVGLGAMGASVAWQATQLGLSVVGIDRYDPPHTFGSTHAETRITRLAVGEGAAYLPVVARSHELWRDLEARSGEALLHQCGGLIVCEPGGPGDVPPVGGDVPGAERWSDFTAATATIADEAGIDYELLAPADVRRRHGVFAVRDDMAAGYEPTAGLLMCERAVAVQLDLARAHGARLHTGEQVLHVEPAADGETVSVHTDADSYRARHVVLAAGPWMPTLVTDADRAVLRVTRQLVYWFEADDLDAFTTERIPFLMWVGPTLADYFALFPTPPTGTQAVKFVSEQLTETTTADDVDRTVSDAEIRAFYERHVAPKTNGVSDRCVKAQVCLYTNTPDDHFLIDADPRSDRITVMSPCSGHGFKHSPALGEAVAHRIAGTPSPVDLGPFTRSHR